MKKFIPLFLIMMVSLIISPAFSESGLELQVDSDSYEIGQIVKITGSTSEKNISLQIKDPNGKTILIRTLSAGDTFSFDFKLPDYLNFGKYEIITSVTLDGIPTIVSKEFELIQKQETNMEIEKPSPLQDNEIQTVDSEEGGGCLIATAAFGSEMAPQVQFLRELRDNIVLQTTSGTSFMTGFNQFYYSFSPYVADYERENPVFKEMVKVALTPMLTSLTLLNYVDVDTEEEMLGYGISIILLNIGMYFVVPAALIIALKKRFL